MESFTIDQELQRKYYLHKWQAATSNVGTWRYQSKLKVGIEWVFKKNWACYKWASLVEQDVWRYCESVIFINLLFIFLESRVKQHYVLTYMYTSYFFSCCCCLVEWTTCGVNQLKKEVFINYVTVVCIQGEF